jgi:hypothetical protein
MFVLDNLHKIEVVLVDLGYVSVINVNYFGKHHSYSFGHDISFSLPELFNNHSLHINRTSELYSFFLKGSEYVQNGTIIVVT